MRFRLTATSSLNRDNPDDASVYRGKYIKKIKNADASLDLPEPVIEGHKVYIDLMYGSQFFNLAKALDRELIIRNENEPTIEIHDDWRE